MTIREIAAVAAPWLADQGYLSMFWVRFDVDYRHRVAVGMIGNGYQVEEYFHPEDDELAWMILERLDRAGGTVQAKVMKIRDPNRLPG